MTVRLITGPPGAGKNEYIKKHAKPQDYILDFDEVKKFFPRLESAKAVRKSIEEDLKGSKRDAWVIRTAADPAKRQAIAERCGADEVIVLETPAELAKQRIAERDKDNPERIQELSASVDHWWSQYAVVQSDLIVKPDTGTNLSDREKQMAQKQGTSEDTTDNEGNGESTDKGFPAETPVAEMTDAQQAAYWKYHSRKHETQAKSREDYDALKALADKWREHEKSQKPADQVQAEEAAEQARKEAESAVKAKYATKLVTAEFKAAVAGRMKPEDLTDLLEDMDLTKYLDDDGDVDTDRVAKKAAIIAPESRSTGGTRRGHQSRRESEKTSSVASGRDLYRETHGKKN